MHLPSSIRRRAVAAALATLTAAAAFAQGFPGGGKGPPPGAGGPRRGMPAPVAAQPHEPAAADPLIGLFEASRSLRSELMIREDQAETWTALRDALRRYADLATAAPGPGADRADPLGRLRARAAQARQRADAFEQAVDRLDALAALLDAGQRRRLDARIEDIVRPAAPPR